MSNRRLTWLQCKVNIVKFNCTHIIRPEISPRAREVMAFCYAVVLNIHAVKTRPELVTSSYRKKICGFNRPHDSKLFMYSKNSQSEERIKKVTDSQAELTGYVWTQSESTKKNLESQKHPDTFGRGTSAFRCDLQRQVVC